MVVWMWSCSKRFIIEYQQVSTFEHINLNDFTKIKLIPHHQKWIKGTKAMRMIGRQKNFHHWKLLRNISKNVCIITGPKYHRSSLMITNLPRGRCLSWRMIKQCRAWRWCLVWKRCIGFQHCDYNSKRDTQVRYNKMKKQLKSIHQTYIGCRLNLSLCSLKYKHYEAFFFG